MGRRRWARGTAWKGSGLLELGTLLCRISEQLARSDCSQSGKSRPKGFWQDSPQTVRLRWPGAVSGSALVGRDDVCPRQGRTGSGSLSRPNTHGMDVVFGRGAHFRPELGDRRSIEPLMFGVVALHQRLNASSVPSACSCCLPKPSAQSSFQ